MIPSTPAAAPRRSISLSLGEGKTAPVADKRWDVADRIDVDRNGVLSDAEIRQYLQKTGILKDPARCAVNEPDIMKKFKAYLQDKHLKSMDGYHTYQQVGDDLHALAAKYPDLCQCVSLGKTYEGRDIWAVKISKGVQGDTTKKPGVVLTGATHAREWMTVETPLALAHALLDNYATDPAMQKDVDAAEIWIVPLVNPDGYEYSRTQDSMWRKNRQPVDDSACAATPSTDPAPAPPSVPDPNGPNVTFGVDINRNYDDGDPNHAVLYRPTSDKPCRTDDDFGVTSDDPNDETFRGLKGSSELETQAMLKLELGRPNIIGVIDHHSYGDDILRPWGHTDQAPERLSEYLDCGNKMVAAMDKPFTLEASVDMYPTSGDATDCLHGAGIMAYTIEMGESFQPDASDIPAASTNVNKADLAFLDWIIQNKTGVVRQPLASIPPFEKSAASPSSGLDWLLEPGLASPLIGLP